MHTPLRVLTTPPSACQLQPLPCHSGGRGCGVLAATEPPVGLSPTPEPQGSESWAPHWGPVQGLPAPPQGHPVVSEPIRRRGRPGRCHESDGRAQGRWGVLACQGPRGSGFPGPAGPGGAQAEGAGRAEAQPRGGLGAAHRLWVGERPQAVIVLLSCSVPQPQVHRLAVHHHIG